MNIQGAIIIPSGTFRGRHTVYVYGMRGIKIKNWIRETFGESDDMVYANSSIDGFENSSNFDSLITDEQLSILLLKWS
jgi:hypothetical protein